MKHLAASLMLAGVLALAGCAQLQSIETGAESLYAKVKAYYDSAPKTLYALESGYTIVQTAAAAFKTTECPSVTSLAGKCATIVPQLRAINHKVLDTIKPIEAYVRANPTLDTKSMIQTAEDAVTLAAKEMSALGVTTGGN